MPTQNFAARAGRSDEVPTPQGVTMFRVKFHNLTAPRYATRAGEGEVSTLKPPETCHCISCHEPICCV